ACSTNRFRQARTKTTRAATHAPATPQAIPVHASKFDKSTARDPSERTFGGEIHRLRSAKKTFSPCPCGSKTVRPARHNENRCEFGKSIKDSRSQGIISRRFEFPGRSASA